MTSLKNYSFAFALALGATAAGCAATTPGTPSGDGSGDGSGSGSGSGSGVAKSLDLTGKYQVQSTFDISTNAPGTVGEIVNDFINATNGPNQPTQWVLDQIIAQMGSGTLKSLLQAAEPFVAGYLNDKLLSYAPDFVTTILQVGNDFGDVSKHFGINETFDVTGSGTTFSSVVTATGLHFTVEGVDSDYAFTDWLYSTTALTPGEEPAPFRPIPLDPAEPQPVFVT